MREQVAVVAQDGAPAQRHDAFRRQRFLHDLRHGQQQHGRQPPSTRRPSSHRHAHAFGLPGPVRILRPAT
ncbi:hypothetical protein G6F32_017004 [Rhizopus arrhizus]|nr:hypothetical protein G6F32_017004 [Rhizopus arrhizus]